MIIHHFQEAPQSCDTTPQLPGFPDVFKLVNCHAVMGIVTCKVQPRSNTANCTLPDDMYVACDASVPGAGFEASDSMVQQLGLVKGGCVQQPPCQNGSSVPYTTGLENVNPISLLFACNPTDELCKYRIPVALLTNDIEVRVEWRMAQREAEGATCMLTHPCI